MKNLILLMCLICVNVAFAKKDSLYSFKWLDDGEKVFVIQNQEYTKSGKFSIDVQIIDSEGSAFQDTLGVGLVANFFFNENWGIDVSYKHYLNDNNQDLTNLLEYPTQAIKPLVSKVDSVISAHLLWTPFYGKINTFNKIHYFDWGLGLGVGQFTISSNYKTFNQSNKNLTFTSETAIGFDFKSFFKFYATENINIGIEYHLSGVSTITQNDGSTSLLTFNDILASIGWVF